MTRFAHFCGGISRLKRQKWRSFDQLVVEGQVVWIDVGTTDVAALPGGLISELAQ